MELYAFQQDQGETRYRIKIPGHALSFKQYQWGGRLFYRAFPQRSRRFLKVLTFAILLFCLMFIGDILDDGYYSHLQLSSWSTECDATDYLFNLKGDEAKAALLALFIAGALVIIIKTRLRYRRYLRTMYEINETIRSGYLLELTDRGVRWTTSSSTFFVVWQKVVGLMSHDRIDYLDLGTLGFLWVPGDLPDYPRDEMKVFIEQHVSEHHR